MSAGLIRGTKSMERSLLALKADTLDTYQTWLIRYFFIDKYLMITLSERSKDHHNHKVSCSRNNEF